MSKTIIPKMTRTHRRLILDNEKLLRANAKVNANTAYHQGDLLILTAGNTAIPAELTEAFIAICGQDVTAEEATIKANNGIEIPIYFGGVFNIEAIKLQGEYLKPEKYDEARMTATFNKIEFSKMEV